MRLLAFIVMVTLILCECSYADESAKPRGTSREPVEFACGDSSAVVVSVFKQELPVEAELLKKFLWENFMNRPETDSFNCRVVGWEERFHSFSRSLVQKAVANSLDGETLGRSLASIFADRGKNAYLPVGAYYASYKGKPVWIVVVRWEWAEVSSREVVGHARVYVIDAKSTRKVGFVTCS